MMRRTGNLAAVIGLLVLGLFVGTPAGRGQDKSGSKGKLLPRVTPELLEGTLKNMDLVFKKDSDKEGHLSYTFQRGESKIRLVNYNGEDLWIEVVYEKKISAAQANQWNTEAKYSRCVLLENDGKTSASLEMQLDCIRGVSEGMVRQFLVRFGGELKEFQKFITK